MKTYYHVIEEWSYNNIGCHGYYTSKEEAEREAARLQNLFIDNYFYVYPSPSKKEPEFVTL
jgi:uncharacterized protein YutD